MNILILSYSNLDSDPRILRQIQALEAQATIYSAGYKPVSKNYIHHTLVRHDRFHANYPLMIRKIISLFYLHARDYLLLKVFKLYDAYYWNFFRRRSFKALSQKKDYHLIIANDIDTLPLALKIANMSNCPVWFDAHEYSPLESSENKRWMSLYSPVITAWCKKYIPKAKICSTVSSGLVTAYKELTSVDFELVLNAPSYQEHSPLECKYPIKFIHHGGAMKGRQPELMIQVFAKLPPEKYELHLMLTLNTEPYYFELVEMAKPYKNIYFHPPVPTLDICKSINQYDIGICIVPPVNLNYEFGLPNKFFEFVQARLMIFIGPLVEMARFINQYDLGIVTSSFDVDEIVESICTITSERVNQYKKNSDRSALSLSGDLSINKIQEIVKRCSYVWNSGNH